MGTFNLCHYHGIIKCILYLWEKTLQWLKMVLQILPLKIVMWSGPHSLHAVKYDIAGRWRSQEDRKITMTWPWGWNHILFPQCSLSVKRISCRFTERTSAHILHIFYHTSKRSTSESCCRNKDAHTARKQEEGKEGWIRIECTVFTCSYRIPVSVWPDKVLVCFFLVDHTPSCYIRCCWSALQFSKMY